jgi:hypothetical protein
MAKKSTKSSRRSRPRKELTSKKQSVAAKKVTPKAVIESEGLDEPVTKTKQKTVKPKKIIEPHIAVAPSVEEIAVDEMVAPQRNRMLISAAALCVVIVALIFTAVTMRSQHEANNDMVKSGQVSQDADKILQSGGSVCSNGGSATTNQGSTSPESVGMMLQNVPSNEIQTPESLGTTSSDLNTLQSASCF